MTDDRQQRIRERAYALWEQEGRPEGDDLRHWVSALQDFGTEHADDFSIAENTSVLGEPDSAPKSKMLNKAKNVKKPKAAAPSKGRDSKSGPSKKGSAQPGAQITTGEESSGASVRHAEGP